MWPFLSQPPGNITKYFIAKSSLTFTAWPKIHIDMLNNGISAFRTLPDHTNKCPPFNFLLPRVQQF